MKKLLIYSVVCVWVLSGNVATIAETTDPATVVAKVNNGEILQSDVDLIMNTFVLPQFQAQNQGQEIPEPQRKQIEQNIINQLITQNLLLQVASKNHITADEALVNQQVEVAKQQRPDIAPEQLKQFIQANLIIQKLIQQEVVSKITISDEEAQQFYEGHKDQFTEPEQVRASHILVMVQSDATQEEKDAARKKIEDILLQVKAGGDFAELAKKYSDCPSKEMGGDLGSFGQGEVVKPFEDAAFALREGEISDIVETQFGYHIIKVTGKKPHRQIPYSEVHDQITQSLFQQKANTEVSNWIADLHAHAIIEILTPNLQGTETPLEETTPTP